MRSLSPPTEERDRVERNRVRIGLSSGVCLFGLWGHAQRCELGCTGGTATSAQVAMNLCHPGDILMPGPVARTVESHIIAHPGTKEQILMPDKAQDSMSEKA